MERRLRRVGRGNAVAVGLHGATGAVVRYRLGELELTVFEGWRAMRRRSD